MFPGTWIVALLAGTVFPPSFEGALQLLALPFYAAIPVSIGIAILKYRLYDIDVVIRKALVVAVLAVFFVAVYALVVGGVGALVETSSSSTLSFAAAVLVAVLFQPVLARARRFADRVVYGKRATPYEVLAEFGDQLAETYAADDVLPRTARVLAEGVGAERAACGSRSATSSAGSRRGPATPGRLVPTITAPTCATRVSCWGRCRSRCPRTIRWTRPRRS